MSRVDQPSVSTAAVDSVETGGSRGVSDTVTGSRGQDGSRGAGESRGAEGLHGTEGSTVEQANCEL